MRFEWDEAKRRRNSSEHGVDFAAAPRFDWAEALTFRQTHASEVRFASFGPIEGRLHCLIWTMRGDARRIISLRKANARESAAYEFQRSKTDPSDP